MAIINFYNFFTGKKVYSLECDNAYTLDDFMNEFDNSDIAWDMQDYIEVDEKYFMLKDDEKIFGVFCPHKGFSFIDVAEHDERVRIKHFFPELTCHIIGE